ncbi:hypothetical protein MKQ68_06140 [Chitinophaga horti]|uniref:SnoaL-like domain-containing protein n=1 Tax=Chitinophaga horti TaxID=2920382 RepID=A0ABY6J4S0_9BACT|nr:hypothetical protein [Chitinophaga horti]UYQ94668.1 hypothetical protein MKQ68_06140 [Chitinophaga horti]
MTALQDFFARYARTSTSEAYEDLTSFYAPSFIAAGPNGNEVYKNDERFVEWLAQVHQFNRKTGLVDMQVLNTTGDSISKSYTMVKVTWSASYRKEGAQNIVFDMHYLLYHRATDPQIVMYISHEDQETVMKEKGVL